MIEIKLPDIGDFADVEVIEVNVSPGDRVAEDDTLIVIESDKASMDVPSPAAGTVASIAVAVGDRVSTGDLLATLEGVEAASSADEAQERPPPASPPEDSGDEAPPPPVASDTPAPPIASAPRTADPAADITTEVVVLGSGPGGYTAAFRAADLGKRVVLVERYPDLGGVCLNVGCIPSKALLHAANVVEEARHLSAHGLDFGEPRLELSKLAAYKDGIVGRLAKGLAGLAKQRRVQVVHGTGRFVDPHAVEVVEGERTLRVAFEHAIVAAGSQASTIPNLPDDPRIMDSTAALALADVPDKLLVIGGGIIGLEMATVFHALGSRVTVVELLEGLMPGCDPDLVKPLHKRLEGRYDAIYLGTKVTAVQAQKRRIKVSFEGEGAPASGLFDRVLVAVGRRPNGDRIGLESTGVEVSDAGFVSVDAQCRTNVAHIFAIGDIAGPPMLAHKATHEGKVAAEVIAGRKSRFEPLGIPSVAYTDPEVAWVGLTEADAKREGIAVEKAVFPWAASGRSLGMGREEGSTKLLFDAESGRLVGAGIVGPRAGDLISEAALALEMGADAEDIGLTIHPHPTLSETVAFAAETVSGSITDLYVPRRKKRQAEDE